MTHVVDGASDTYARGSVGPSGLRYRETFGGPATAGLGESTLVRSTAAGGGGFAAPADELVDILLHCVSHPRDLPAPCRTRLGELVSRLRSDPRSAGRAAERIQRELAPGLTRTEILADVVHERWAALLVRRRRLRFGLLRAPVRSALAWRPGTSMGEAGGPEEDAGGDESGESVSDEQIRGSGLLLAGRGFSTGLKFLAEIIVVRYLTTAEYGAWTYALSAVVFLRGLSTLGLNRAVTRFVPIHLERGEERELFGVATFVLASLALAGAAVVTAFYLFPHQVAAIAGIGEEQPLELLFIVVLLIPVEAIDDFLTGLCAAFADSRTIFVRRYLLNPGLRIGVALTLVLLEADVRVLAYGYLITGLAGIAYYGWSVYHEMRRRGLLRRTLLRRLRLPVRKVLSYTVPVMTADWCSILMTTSAPLLLGYFADMSTVALFRVVMPLVALNHVVYQSFRVLFEPAASLLHARRDHGGLERLYWRSAVWVAVLTFPAFAVSFTASDALTIHLFGERYASAAPILSLLALGMFVDVALGFNSATLRVLGKIRWLLGVNVTAAVIHITLNLMLIPAMGALGAGVATGASWLAYAVLKQVGLRLATGVRWFDRRYADPYLMIAICTSVLMILRVGSPVDERVLAPVVAVAVVAVFLRARASLSITETFPELARVPALKALLG